MSKQPQAEVRLDMRIVTGARPKDESDREWSTRIVSELVPKIIDTIIYRLTTDVNLGGRRDGKTLEYEAVMQSLCIILCENMCSTWFMLGDSKEQLLLLIDEMYSDFEEDMTSAIEEQDPDNDIPIPTVTGVGHA